MGTMVGLYGNPILQAKSLAKLIDMDNEGDLGDLLALTRGCIIAVEETTESEEYKIEATLSFEGAGKQFYTMKYINDILEDIIEMNAINDKFDLYSILMEIEKMLDYTNPYLVKLERKVRQNKFNTPFDIERDENGNINLAYLYTYQSEQTPMNEIYNTLFIALKFVTMKQIEQKLTQFCTGEVVCANNCLTVTYNTSSMDVNEILVNLFSLVSDDDLISTCLSNVKVSVPSSRDITFIFPNMPDTMPEYTDTLYECDYVLYSESKQGIEANKDSFMKELEERMALAPDTKVDYILIQEDDKNDALLAKSLSKANNIPALKSLVGNPTKLKWVGQSGDAEQNKIGHNSYFARNKEIAETEDEASPTIDEAIQYSNSITETGVTDRQTIDFDTLKSELTRVGLSGFNSLHVHSWGENNVEVKLDVINAKDIKTDILDDYDVVKVAINNKEILMHYMKEFDLQQVPLDYIQEHIQAEKRLLSDKDISEISKDFTKHNVDAINNVLNQTKENLLQYYSNQTETSIRDSYIKIVLSDICDEFYNTLKRSIINQKFDYNIDDTEPNAYVGANLKIILLRTLYDQIILNSRKYWLKGVDEALKDPQQPNLPIITKLLEEIL